MDLFFKKQILSHVNIVILLVLDADRQCVTSLVGFSVETGSLLACTQTAHGLHFISEDKSHLLPSAAHHRSGLRLENAPYFAILFPIQRFFSV